MTWLFSLLQMIPGLSALASKFIDKYYDSKVQITMSRLQCTRDVAVQHLQATATIDGNRIGFFHAIKDSPVLLLIVAGFAFPLIFYINKVVVWDMCLGLGSTPSIKDANTVEWGRAIIYGIFGTSGVMAASKVVGSAIASIGKAN